MTMLETRIFPYHAFDKTTGWRIDMPTDIPPGTRVLCLYRVSTDKQLYFTENNEADIPMQRVRCHAFCEQMGWTIICELQEEGVSGHKVRAEKRDKIQLIKEYAQKKMFDILLVFMFDRLGRIADETPFLVEWFARNGIRVWSTQEGEQRFESHTDKLTNYIRFWQADGESEKTSIRTSNSMGILTEQGCFTGGSLAYGYQYVKTGRTNKRKQEVNDLAICDEEAYVVRLMFQLAADEGYGAQKLANHLNGKGIKNRSGKNWHPASIQGMLRNVLYTGVLRSGKSRSPVQEALRIVDDTTFERVQAMLQARSYKNTDKRSVPLNTRGRSLLAGNIFCGHCGARLCITTSGKGRPREDGTDAVRMRYTCQTKSRKHGECDGQTGYTVKKLDAMIEAIIKGIFRQLHRVSREDIRNACCDADFNDRQAFFVKAKRDLEKAERDLQKLKAEIVKSIVGESAFAPDLLNAAIREQEKLCADLRGVYAEAKAALDNCFTQQSEFERQYDNLLEWADAYSDADMPAKKVIVSYLIDRVDVYRDYRLKITFNIGIEKLLLGLRSLNESRRQIDRNSEKVYIEAS